MLSIEYITKKWGQKNSCPHFNIDKATIFENIKELPVWLVYMLYLKYNINCDWFSIIRNLVNNFL
jgi:hypothetical protein